MTGSNPALIVGCGDMAANSARLIGKRQPLLFIDIDEVRLGHTVETFRADGYDAVGRRVDITSKSDIDALATYIGETGLSLIAHVAGLGPSIGDWRKILAVNLVGPALVAKHIGPLIDPGGAAVFVASIAGYFDDLDSGFMDILADPLHEGFYERVERYYTEPLDGYGSYRYSKAALQQLAENLSVEWGPRRVRALSVSPGLVLTEMGARERKHNPATGDFTKMTPLRREATVQELASIIDFAVSDAAAYLNGIDLLADGGLRAGWRAAEASGEMLRHIR